jgi:anti-sigma regulatory factor (Ser/Thr protein kinase)
MPGVFELAVDADLGNLGEIRSFVKQAGAALGVRDDALGDLCLVVDEAVTNVILHGYRGARGPVEIHVQRDGDAVVILLRDRARAFDGRGIQAPHLDESLAERKFGGMGVYLIRKLTDEAEYRPLAGRGNELRLVKRGAIEAA